MVCVGRKCGKRSRESELFCKGEKFSLDRCLNIVDIEWQEGKSTEEWAIKLVELLQCASILK